MKLLTIFASLLITGGIFFSPGKKNLKGTWLIESSQNECGARVLRIQMHQGIWKGLIDYPALRRYDQPVTSIHSEKNLVSIELNSRSYIEGFWVNDTLITATYIDNHIRIPVKLQRQ